MFQRVTTAALHAGPPDLRDVPADGDLGTGQSSSWVFYRIRKQLEFTELIPELEQNVKFENNDSVVTKFRSSDRSRLSSIESLIKNLKFYTP